MNRNVLKFAPMALVLALAAGCASTTKDVDEAKSMAAAAQKSADEAKQAAAEAKSVADQALQAANEAKTEAANANSRIDRAFKKSMHK